jgi:serine/threonine protein kinase
MTLACVADFVAHLDRLQLLEAGQVEAVRAGLPGGGDDPVTLGRELIRRGWLTGFQVNQLVQGGGQGLRIGDYVLFDRLGEGGMGLVFKARHHRRGDVVALKVLRQTHGTNAEVVQRFEREIRAVTQLDHANVVRALDGGEAAGSYFLAMELLEGIDLERLVRDVGPLSVARACEYVRQTAQGLQHIHAKGLVHRDIKPANLLVVGLRRHGISGSSALLPRGPGLLARWGTVKVLDLGLARREGWDEGPGQLTQFDRLVGTPDFIAPEQARNSHACDIRADLYSLGCTFFYLLTGEVPFPAGSLTERLLRHQMEAPPSVEAVRRAHVLKDQAAGGPGATTRAEVPAAVAALVQKLLAKAPEQRPQTPGEVAEALDAFLAQALPASLHRRHAETAAIGPAATAARTAEFVPGAAVASGPPRPRQATEPLPLPVPGRPRRRARKLVALGARAGVLFLLGLLATWLASWGAGPPPQARAQTIQPAEAAWEVFQAKARRYRIRPQELWGDLLDFRARFPGAMAAPVAEFQAHLPSALDALRPDDPLSPTEAPGRPGDVVAVLGGHETRTPTLALAVSPDGRQIAGAWADAPLRIWDLGRGAPGDGMTLGGANNVARALAYSPTGGLLAVGCRDGTLVLWSTYNRKPRVTVAAHPAAVAAVAMSPGGKLLATGGRDGAVRWWDPTTGRARPGPALPASSGVISLAFSPDGAFLARGGADGSLAVGRVSEAAEPAQAAGPRQDQPIRTVAFSPDGGKLAYGAGTVIHLGNWTASGFAEDAVLQADAGAIQALAFGPDGKLLASVRDDGLLVVWDVGRGVRLRQWALPGPAHGVAFAPDGRHLVTANGDGTLWVLRLHLSTFWPRRP